MEFDIANLLIVNRVTVFPDLSLTVVWTAITLIFQGSESKPCSVMLDITQSYRDTFLQGFFQ